MRKSSFVLMGICCGGLVLVGCQDNNGTAEGENGGEQPSGIAVGAAPLGGTFHVYGTGWGEMIGNELDINVNVESTGGPMDNIQFVDRGEMDVGMVTMGPAYEGYHGEEWAEEAYDNIRGLFPMYVSYLHWFSMPDSGIESLQDIEGATIGTGASGGTPDYYGQRIFEDLGIEPQRVVHGSFDDYANQMRDGQMEVAGVFAPAGHPTISEMTQTDDVHIFGVGEESESLAEEYNITHGILEEDGYEGLDEDIETLTVYSSFIVNQELSDEFVYDLLEATFDNQERIEEVHQTGSELSLDNVEDGITAFPLHPGAVQYYEDQGIDLPESAIPPEMD